MADWFVCVMGICTVFAGLIALIFICMVMSAICKMFAKPEAPKAQTANKQNSVAASGSAVIANKAEIVAAACAVIAEELGEDVKNIKVVSFKKA